LCNNSLATTVWGLLGSAPFCISDYLWRSIPYSRKTE